MKMRILSFLLFFYVILLFWSRVRCCKRSRRRTSKSITKPSPTSKCSFLPATSRTCKLVLEHNCTSRLHYDNYMATISGNETVFRNISDMLLDGGCDCRRRSIELFCQLNLPRCSISASEPSTSCDAPTNSVANVSLPCLAYCLEVVNKCLTGISEKLVSKVFALFNRTTEDDITKLCHQLPNGTCWNSKPLPDGCTGQTNLRPATTSHLGAPGVAAVAIMAVCLVATAFLGSYFWQRRRNVAKAQPMRTQNDGNVTNEVERSSREAAGNVLYVQPDKPLQRTDVYTNIDA